MTTAAAHPPSSPAAHIVVVGSGLAGYGVLRELRRRAPEARLTLVTADDGDFYSKPALSTALAKGKDPDGLVTTPAAKMAESSRIDLRARTRVESIDRAGQTLLTTAGPISYDFLILALGADPVRPTIGGDAAGAALSINSLDDYRLFRQKLRPGDHVLIMGAGLVGSEFANDLSAVGHRVTVVDPLLQPLGQLVPPAVGEGLRDALSATGVAWKLGRMVGAVDKAGDGFRVTLDDGAVVEADLVLSGIGLRPNIRLAAEAGLVTDRGFKVDAQGQTSDPHIYAIGDCAQYLHGVSAYVTPIMAAARAIAPSVLGDPTDMRFPPLSVQAKTTVYPIALLPAPGGRAGIWERMISSSGGAKHLFKDVEGLVRGYVLTGTCCDERVDLDRSLSELTATKGGA